MPKAAELREQARTKRDLAARARQWARSLSMDADRMQLLQPAADLEREADEFEERADRLDRAALRPLSNNGKHSNRPTRPPIPPIRKTNPKGWVFKAASKVREEG
jgi:hypothetical protein